MPQGPCPLDHTLALARTGLMTEVSVAIALQNGHHRRHFLQTILVGHFLHPLQLFVQRQFLVAMEILQPAAVFQGQRKALEKLGYLLNCGDGGVVVGSGRAPLSVFVGQSLDAGGGQVFLVGVNLSLKVVRPLGQVEDPSCWCRRTWKSPGERVAFGIRAEFAVRLVSWNGRRRKRKSRSARAPSQGNPG